MSMRTVLVLILAIICGVAVAVGASQLRGRTTRIKVAKSSVLVAALDIPRGETVTSEMLENIDWPKELIPKTALSELDQAVDRAAMVPIVAGDLMLDGKLAPRDAGRGLAALIRPGMRAYTVQTTKVNSQVAGFILPGNQVDVLLTLRGNPNDGTGGGSTTTLLQAVEILAVDQRLDAPAENKVDPADLRSVTLLVTPEQVALLELGQNMGTLSLSLRNAEDTAQAHTRPATLADIRFRQEKPVESEEAAPGGVTSAEAAVLKEPVTFKIRTLRGNHSGEVVVSAVK